jgi:predicted unusual protein kinase regulating ubiquinone biosynthesis (AarF/ABC1/UbiB family)
MHSDPHPGNYLFNHDGTLGLIDFGCVKHLKPEVVRCYSQFWSREWLHDSRMFREIVKVIFGSSDAAKSAHVQNCMKSIAEFYECFHPLKTPDVPLNLGDPKFMDALRELAAVLLRNKFISPEFVFLSRTESGICNILHLLKARVTTTRIAQEHLRQIRRKKDP